jgi:hypothetical protein
MNMVPSFIPLDVYQSAQNDLRSALSPFLVAAREITVQPITGSVIQDWKAQWTTPRLGSGNCYDWGHIIKKYASPGSDFFYALYAGKNLSGMISATICPDWSGIGHPGRGAVNISLLEASPNPQRPLKGAVVHSLLYVADRVAAAGGLSFTVLEHPTDEALRIYEGLGYEGYYPAPEGSLCFRPVTGAGPQVPVWLQEGRRMADTPRPVRRPGMGFLESRTP